MSLKESNTDIQMFSSGTFCIFAILSFSAHIESKYTIFSFESLAANLQLISANANSTSSETFAKSFAAIKVLSLLFVRSILILTSLVISLRHLYTLVRSVKDYKKSRRMVGVSPWLPGNKRLIYRLIDACDWI